MKTKLFALLGILFFVAGASFAQQVSVDWDHNITDFSRFKTYAWEASRRPLPDQLMDQRIVGDIDAQLTAKGMQKVGLDQNPDLVVTYGVGIRQQRSAVINGMGGWRFGGGMATIQPETEDVGTLVVQMSDWKAQQLIWRGTVVKAIASNNPQKNSESIQKGITKLFKNYPPKMKK